MNFDQVIKQHPHKTIYRDGDNIIKVFDESYSKTFALNEALNNARVEETGLNVPELRGVTMVDGKWAIVTERIEGETIQQLMLDHPEQEDALLARFVDIQIEVLSKSCPLLNPLTEKLQKRISSSGLDATTRYDLHTRLASMKVHTKVCHGDFHPANVIITPDDKAYIIDWNHAAQGNGSADVATTYISLWLDGKPKLADRYLNLYCQKTDTAKQYVQKWIPIVAAAYLNRPNVSEEMKLLLHQWAEVVEYE